MLQCGMRPWCEGGDGAARGAWGYPTPPSHGGLPQAEAPGPGCPPGASPVALRPRPGQAGGDGSERLRRQPEHPAGSRAGLAEGAISWGGTPTAGRAGTRDGHPVGGCGSGELHPHPGTPGLSPAALGSRLGCGAAGRAGRGVPGCSTRDRKRGMVGSSQTGRLWICSPAWVLVLSHGPGLHPQTGQQRSRLVVPFSPHTQPRRGFGHAAALRFATRNRLVAGHRIPECLGLAGTSVGHPDQPPAQAGSPRAGCTAPRPGGS